MAYLEKVIIKGFKKFKNFEVTFNKDMNVLVGENEAGKSTILEAIDLTLNQKLYNLLDGSNEQLFTLHNVETFKTEPKIGNLPKIEIELYLNMDSEILITKQHFLGLDYTNGDIIKENKTGIKFMYHFDMDFESEFQELDFTENGSLPLEFYKIEWLTFQGGSYKKLKNPVRSLFIDNSTLKNDIYGSYAKQVYEKKIDINTRRRLSYKLKSHINTFLNEEAKNLLIGKQSIAIDDKKSSITKIIDIKEDKISIQNMGKGRENIVKTEVALQIDTNLVLVEEPENHLSHSNTKKLIEMIKDEVKQSQVIITTHNPLVISRLNISKTIWITSTKAISLNDVDSKVANFFEKADNLNLLEFILSEKVILVEGATEYIYLPYFFEKDFQRSPEKSGIHVISMSGITYKNYIEIAKHIGKKLLVITDNDGNVERIEKIKCMNNKFKEDGYLIKVQCDDDVKKKTFEIAFFSENEDVLKTYKETSKVSTMYKGTEFSSKALAYMLKNKADSAIEIISDSKFNNEINSPKYISEGLKWLEE